MIAIIPLQNHSIEANGSMQLQYLMWFENYVVCLAWGILTAWNTARAFTEFVSSSSQTKAARVRLIKPLVLLQGLIYCHTYLRAYGISFRWKPSNHSLLLSCIYKTFSRRILFLFNQLWQVILLLGTQEDPRSVLTPFYLPSLSIVHSIPSLSSRTQNPFCCFHFSTSRLLFSSSNFLT